MRWCVYCKRMVRGTKNLSVLSWVLIILLSGFSLGLFLFLFIPYFLLIKRYSCPICGTSELLRHQPKAA